jgi:hypothetical protein
VLAGFVVLRSITHITWCQLQYDAAADRLSRALQLADVGGTKARLAALQNDASSKDIWDDPAKAQAIVTEISGLKDELAQVEG